MPSAPQLSVALLAVAFALTSATNAGARPAALKKGPEVKLIDRKEQVLQATVTILAKGCAGSVVAEHSRVLTAAHCIPMGAERLLVKLRNGSIIESTLEYLDRDSDLALLRLDTPAQVEPLKLATVLPAAGQLVLFAGRADRRSRSQVARVERVGQCPSLPGVEKAVFTTLKAKPGDSGAPVVNGDLRVLGVIHGGATCHIAAPTAALAQKIAAGKLPAFQPDAPQSQSQAQDAADASRGFDNRQVTKTYKAGPFVFEKYPNGFRFRWSAKWGFGQGR